MVIPTSEQYSQIMQIYYKNNDSVRAMYRALRPIFNRRNCLSKHVIRVTIDRFRASFTLVVNAHRIRYCMGYYLRQ